MAAALGMPAYRVLTNATMNRVAEAAPKSTTELESIAGIGPDTIEQFGYDIVELIRSAIEEMDGVEEEIPIASDPEPELPEPGLRETIAPVMDEPADETPVDSLDETPGNNLTPPDTPGDSNDAYWTWRLFHDGYTMSQVVSIRRRTPPEIQADLVAAASAGHTIDSAWLISPDQQREVVAASKRHAVGTPR
jgi:ATP-dependent DNA helicase RecQ